MRLICALLVCAPAYADPCLGTSSIDGIAVDADGHGLAGVGVHAEPADHVDGWSTMTGSDGTFHIACVRAGGVYIEAGNETLATTPQVIDVPVGKTAKVRFEMVATIIAGDVTANGSPAAHAKITVHGPIEGANNQEADADVDAQGHFTIRAMPPGRYKLEVHDGKRATTRVVTTSDDKLKIEL